MTLTSQLPAQFMNWRDHNGVKIPCTPDGRNANAHDPKNWTTYERAASYPYGVAFVLTESDPWFFLDLDKCFVNGAWTPESSAIFQSFAGAWGEVSVSGTGLHIMGKCDASRLQDRRNKWDGWLEFYTKERFIAFGHGWSRIGGVESDRDWTDQLLRLVPQREFLGDLPDGVDPAYTGPEDDTQLIEMALRSSSAANAFGDGVTFKDLWECNVTRLSAAYPSYDGQGGFDHSSADMALMSHLAFWTGKDMPRMDRLFRKSALMREKYAKRDDYRTETVQKAARICRSVYDRPRVAVEAAGGAAAHSHEQMLTISEMMTYFEGCVYVRDLHRVLVPDGALLKPEQFNAVYGGHQFQMFSDMTKPSRKAFEALTENLVYRFPQATGVAFRPDRPTGEIGDDGCVNIYKKPDVRIEPGDISPFLDFMSRILPDQNDREIIFNYLASLVQNPGVKFQWAPVLQGTEGNGKTLIASCAAYVIGLEHVHEPRASQLAEKYNGFLEDNLLIIVEEIHMGGRREMLDELKPMITNRRIEIRGMAQEKRMVDNVSNWFFCTNHRDAVIKSKNDRRYAVFYTAQQSAEDIERDGMSGRFFPDLYNWLNDVGYARIGHWLLNYPIRADLDPAGDCHRAPQTSSTHEVLEASISPVEAEIINAVESDRAGFRGGWVSSKALDALLKERGYRIPRSIIGTIMRDRGYSKWGRAPRMIFDEGGERPSLWYCGEIGTVTFEDYLSAQGYRG